LTNGALRDKYIVFGLVVNTPIPLPEALPADPLRQADVTVNVIADESDIKAPAGLNASGAASSGPYTDAAFKNARENRLWWHLSPEAGYTIFNCQTGLFEIIDGAVINIWMYPDADTELAKIFLLGSALGVIQIQRGRLPIHGGAVCSGNEAVIITGGPGSGKSTMTSAFVRNGYKYLADDVSSVSIEGGRAYVVPAYPQRKLVRDAFKPLGYDPDEHIIVDRERDKLAIRDSANWITEPLVLSTIFELRPTGPESAVSVTPVTGLDTISLVSRSLYRAWMHRSGRDIKPAVYEGMLSVAAQARIFNVGTPRDIDGVTTTAANIAKALNI